VATGLTLKDQAALFALMVVARPATNRELWEVAGLTIDTAVRRSVNADVARIHTRKRGAVNTHALTAAGLSWCEAALAVGRPDGARFPAGVLYAVLGGLGQYLERTGTKITQLFEPDLEEWIRAVYAELTVRRQPGSWVKLSAVRPWLEDAARDDVDGVLDLMVDQPDVHLMAELNQRVLTDDDRRAAVEIGGEPRHLLRIGPA
jgi:hypothetical protein